MVKTFENPGFSISKTMLKKIKQKEYITDEGGIIPDLI